MEDDIIPGIHAARRYLTSQRVWMEADRAATMHLLADARALIERSRELLRRPLPPDQRRARVISDRS